MLAWKACASVAAMALLATMAARGDDAPVTTIVVGPARAAAGAAHGALADRGEYWLGVFASRVSPALQAQLKLSKNQGLLVEDVQPTGPAAKAGIQQHDILLTGNGKPLADIRDLLHLIAEVKDGKLTLELLRGGTRETVTVTPAKRPADKAGESAAQWIDSLNFAEGRPLEFHIIRPGQILPPGGPLPGLPGIATANAEGTITIVGSAVAAPGIPNQRMLSPEVEKRLADLQKQVDELRKSVEALQRKALKNEAGATH